MRRHREEILAAIERYYAETGIGPSMRCIMTMTGIPSTSIVSYNIRLLEKDGDVRVIMDGYGRRMVAGGVVPSQKRRMEKAMYG